MVGHLNSEVGDGIILMMPGLPVSQLGAVVVHWLKMPTYGMSEVAQG